MTKKSSKNGIVNYIKDKRIGGNEYSKREVEKKVLKGSPKQ